MGSIWSLVLRATSGEFRMVSPQSVIGASAGVPAYQGREMRCSCRLSLSPPRLPLSLSDFPVAVGDRYHPGGLSLSPLYRSCRRCRRSLSLSPPSRCRPVGFRCRCPLSLSPRLAGALHRRGVPDIRSIGCRFSSACGGGRARKWWEASAGWGKRRFSKRDRRFVLRGGMQIRSADSFVTQSRVWLRVEKLTSEPTSPLIYARTLAVRLG